MKKTLIVILILVAWSAIIYPLRQLVRERLDPVIGFVSSFAQDFIALVYQPAPCTQPILYDILSFDTRFGITKEYFLSALSDAEAIWEKPFGKELFSYIPTSRGLKVNLIYDYRQQATSKLTSIDSAMKDDQASYDALKRRYTAMKTDIASAKSDFEAQVAAFEAKNKAYQASVDYWNARGGAPSADYKKLEAQRVDLNAESNRLKSLQNALNAEIGEMGKTVTELNRLAGILNIAVNEYNTVGVSRGDEFEEGVYKSDGRNKEIDIYEFTDRDKLVRILAHELGHALGLNHITDPKAIMYAYNQGVNSVATKADLAELDSVCKTGK